MIKTIIFVMGVIVIDIITIMIDIKDFPTKDSRCKGKHDF